MNSLTEENTCMLKRDEDLNISRKKRNRRFHRKHNKNSSFRERRKARKAAVMKCKMENIKNFSGIEFFLRSEVP